MTNSSTSVTSPIVSSHPPNQNDDNNNEQTININLKVTKTVPFKVRKDDKIRKLKMACYKEGVSESLQQLIFNNQTLCDDKTLAFYGVDENSTLELLLNTVSEFSRILYVKIPSKHKVIKIHARVDDYILQLKSVVVIKERLGSPDYDLMYAGKILKSYQTLTSLNLVDNALLYLVPRPKDLLSIKVATYSKGMINVEVRKFQTIGELKLLLTSMTSTPLEGAKLMCFGKELKDSRTIASYEIDELDCLHLMTAIPITVSIQPHSSIDLTIMPWEDSRSVVAKVLKKMKVPVRPHPLFFNGVRLEEGQRLSAHGVIEGSTLEMGAPIIDN